MTVYMQRLYSWWNQSNFQINKSIMDNLNYDFKQVMYFFNATERVEHTYWLKYLEGIK